jgi:hypothetical protein
MRLIYIHYIRNSHSPINVRPKVPLHSEPSSALNTEVLVSSHRMLRRGLQKSSNPIKWSTVSWTLGLAALAGEILTSRDKGTYFHVW